MFSDNLPRPVEDNLLRIAQEAINNALAHANPEHVVVNLTFDINRVQLSVRDDGRGFDPSGSQSEWTLRSRWHARASADESAEPLR